MRTILVTGAASGLGCALAQHLADSDTHLILVSRDAARLAACAGRLTGCGRVTQHRVDLCDREALQQLVADVRAGGRLDVLVNNAGVTQRSLAADTQLDVFRRVMQVDWEAPVALASGLLPLLRASHGSIVNIGSMAGWMPVLGRAGYCSAKAALAQFFEVLRGEQGDAVHILMVYPSFLATPMDVNALGADGGPANHPRSTVGKIRSADWMAQRIVHALAARQCRVFSDRFTVLASILYRIAPNTYHRLMRRRFAVELKHHNPQAE